MADVRIAPPAGPEDAAWLAELWRREWAGEIMVSRGCLHRLCDLSGLIASLGDERVGAATYRIDADGCELTSLNALRSSLGIGTALLTAVEAAARGAGCHRVWLITTNDNTNALRFYQLRGYRLAALHVGAVDEARRTLKPSIPLTGDDGIPLHDEIELSKLL